ncbi:MAG: type II secretion system secretin GspD, partial [Proteobacteria bacterium]|nr:type II secretion system secretin GspD [Pseudomonadota bacterium]
RAVSPATPGGEAGVPQAATPEKSMTGSPAGSAPAQDTGRRSPFTPQAGTPATTSPSILPPAGGTPSPVTAAAGQKPAETSPAPSPAASPQSGRYVTIDFDNVDISVFIKFVSELTGKNFVIDEKVKGKVTIISPKKIAVDEVYKLFESVLEIYGFATVQAGDVIKVIPALEARGKNLELRLKREEIAPEDKIVTQILSLQHATPDDMKKVLDPLISKTSVILAYPPTGMLIITDVLSNIKRLQDIVTALDVEGVGELITYVPLKYASATEMAKSLTTIFQQQAAPGRRVIAPIKIVADDRTNALIILAAENDTTRIRELVNLMDKEIPKGAGTIRVYYLQNAKAEDLVKVLTGLPQQAKPTDTKAPATATAPALSKNVQVMADKSTNSLIITADTADYLVIEDVIRKLDITRPMVYLEGLIMEVNADKSFGVGVEWSALKDVGATGIGQDGSRNVGAVGFRGSSIIPQVNAAGTFSMPGGFSLGVIGAGISIAAGGTTVLFPNIGAVLQAYQNDNDVRILATPQLLTLDNEEAEIKVGQNVPYVTRQDTTIGSTTNYSNYEYKDVGVTLKVTPQINKEGFVRMKLDQSVTKLVSQSAAVDDLGNKVLTPTTLNRTAKTTVVVKSGETVVIGGMIQDDSSEGTYKVPLLGDIPLLGWLFKSRAKSNQRTNLFVFITPRIIEQPEDARKIQEEKMDYMRTIQEGTIRTAPQKKTEAKEKE